MKKFTFLLGIIFCVTATALRAEVIEPLSPQTSNAQSEAADDSSVVYGLSARTRADGSPLPDINGKLSLEDCIELALANSPSAINAQLAQQSARVELNLAKGEFLPTASAGASNTYNAHKTDHFSTQESHNGNVYAEASLSIRGITDIARNVNVKQAAVEQADLKFQTVKNELIRTVKKHYYTLLSALRAVEIRTQSRDVYQEQFDRTSEYFRLGLRPKVDVTTAEVNLNNESLRLIRAQNAVKTASAALANTLGIVTPRVLDIAEISEFDNFTISLEEALRIAYENRPDVASANLDVKISHLRLNQAKSAFFPTFSFAASFTKSGDTFKLDNEDTRLMLGVELPLFNAFKTYNSVKQARLTMQSTQNNTRNLLNNVFLEVQKAHILLQEAAESIPIAQLNEEKAKENLALAQGRYNEGISDIIELKDAEAAYTDAQLSLLSARYDYGAAVADLKQAMGSY